MKKLIFSLLSLFVCICVMSCGAQDKALGDSSVMKEKLDNMEYTLYQDIFYNGSGDKYAGKEFSKEGTFAVIYDSFNDRERYYVWGYADETRCCDWQWEFVTEDPSSLPSPGSYISVSGSFEKNDDALDKYWITEAMVTTMQTYSASVCEMDLSVMSTTLARVQLANMVNYAEKYSGKTICVYARVAADSKIQNPYYDGDWSLPYEYDKDAPAIGTKVRVKGTFEGTGISDSVIRVDNMDVQ